MKKYSLVLIGTAVAVALTYGAVETRAANVPPAKVEPVTASGQPFGATSLPLAQHGYVEQEFYISGTANRYRITAPLATAQIIDGGFPYRSRVLVRRPAKQKDFNGVVVVEWLNVSLGQDVDFEFAAMYDHLIREGYAYVAVSAQLVGLKTLVTHVPDRYGSLSIGAPNVDPMGGGMIDRTGDVLSWDIFSQTAAALRSQPSTLLGDLKPKMIIALGESQSAGRLTQYYNSIQPLHGVYDGFLTYDRAGALRTDTGVKSISIGTQASASMMAALPGMSASTPDDSNHRWYEIAGASHVSLADITYLDPIVKRDGAQQGPNGARSITDAILSQGCQKTPLFSRVPSGVVLNAALDHLVKWIKTGEQPPSAPRFERTSAGALVFDANHHVKGGVRLSEYDAPIADNSGGDNPPSPFCALGGYHFDYDEAKLCSLYGNQAGYVHAVESTTKLAERAGFVLKADAEQTIKDARSFNFPHCAGRNTSSSAAPSQ